MKEDHQHMTQPTHGRPYLKFWINMALGLVVMYGVMFSMIDTGADFSNNLNMLYMAVTMAAPMGIFMLATMQGMFADRRLNAMHYLILALLTAVSLWATRKQAGIDDEQFIASMIPHHSGAILMCRQAELGDAELSALCDRISRSQRDEIEQMNGIAERLKQSP